MQIKKPNDMKFVRESLIRLLAPLAALLASTFPHRGRLFCIRFTLGEQSENPIYVIGV